MTLKARQGDWINSLNPRIEKGYSVVTVCHEESFSYKGRTIQILHYYYDFNNTIGFRYVINYKGDNEGFGDISTSVKQLIIDAAMKRIDEIVS